MTDKTNGGGEGIALVQFEETVWGWHGCRNHQRRPLINRGAWENHFLGKALMDSVLGIRRGAQKPEEPGCFP